MRLGELPAQEQRRDGKQEVIERRDEIVSVTLVKGLTLIRRLTLIRSITLARNDSITPCSRRYPPPLLGEPKSLDNSGDRELSLAFKYNYSSRSGQ